MPESFVIRIHEIYIINSVNHGQKYHLLFFYILVLISVLGLFYCAKKRPKHLKCVIYTLFNVLRFASTNCLGTAPNGDDRQKKTLLDQYTFVAPLRI